MKFKRECDLLFHKAEQDLELAKLAIDSKKIDSEQILFHLQQSAEKYIKSLLSFLKIEFPKTHDIDSLISILKAQLPSLPEYTDSFVDLSDYAVEGRYSFVIDPEIDAKDYVEKLHDFSMFVHNFISK